MNLLELAAAEAAAAARKNVAEAEWRYTWWGTSDGMVAVPEAEIKTVMQELAAVLGCSTSWLGTRRRTAAKIAEELHGDPLLFTVPPRLAIEWVRAGRSLDVAGARHLVQWEADERSLRELAAELGTAGRSWASKAELDQREAATPSVEAIRQALADPATAREVVAHGPTRAAFQGAADSWAHEATRHTQWTPPPMNTVQDDQLSQLTLDLMRARELVAEARRISNDLPLDADVTAGVIARLGAVVAEAEAMKMSLSAHADFDVQLERLGGTR